MKRAYLAVAAASIVAASCGGATDPTAVSGGTPTSDAPGSAPQPSVTVEIPDGDIANVTTVFDGDSFEAEVDGVVVEVRMLGINAPEGDECHGDVARDRLRELVSGGPVTLVAEGEDAEDRFGRLLRSVYSDGQFVNATMVAEGHAVALQSGDPQEETLVALLDLAATARVGLWAPDACGETAPAGIRIFEIEYDPPGRDFENKSEEWITILNEGDAAIDVSGWILRDESSTHRYQFNPLETLDPGDGLRIRTGCGEDRGDDRYWCADDAVWSNGGDTVILQTAGGAVVDWVRYEGDF